MKLPKNTLLDAGGPLLFLFGFHLLIGNLIIGLAEFYFVKKIFKIALDRRGLLIIVLGNYLSLFVGFYGSMIFNISSGQNTFQAMIGPLTVTLVVSILVEWIFFYKAIHRVARETSIRKTLFITSAAQIFSYSLMLIYYFVTRVSVD